jgi:hypothetical protein
LAACAAQHKPQHPYAKQGVLLVLHYEEFIGGKGNDMEELGR